MGESVSVQLVLRKGDGSSRLDEVPMMVDLDLWDRKEAGGVLVGSSLLLTTLSEKKLTASKDVRL
jgi:hypothetical protein